MSHQPRPHVDRETVVRLWLRRQGLARPRGAVKLSRRALVDHLERTGALQLDTVNVLDRAHYLTLWSRFGAYDRRAVDRWVYRDRVAYEYWGHEASILPISHLPIGMRRMRGFPPKSMKERSWWPRFQTPASSKRRVLRRIDEEGPLGSADFETRPGEGPIGGAMPLQKEDRRSLHLLWQAGRIAVTRRRHFRRTFDLAERVYPDDVEPATGAELQDSWLLIGLSGNGIASEKHLVNYWTGPALKAPERKRVIARNLRAGRVVEVEVEGSKGPFYATPETLEGLGRLPEPRGTNLICPFDSLLWQRRRAEDLLGFEYRVEIYVPPPEREYGYYVLPILHDGRLVGRVDPKLHRDRAELEIKRIHLEPEFARDRRFDEGFAETLHSLAEFVGAERIAMPRGWKRLV